MAASKGIYENVCAENMRLMGFGKIFKQASVSGGDSEASWLQQFLSCLDTSGQFFPRFYFISNDDLLEILGQAADANVTLRKVVGWAVCHC